MILALIIVLACLLSSSGFADGAVPGGFDLVINDVSGVDEPWPLIGGLPFAEGALRDARHVRVVDARGAEVPAQVDVAATWRDGSIRWALAGFTASPQGVYRIEFGPGIARSAPDAPLKVTQHAGGVLTIDTGAAVYTFKSDMLLPDAARMQELPFLADSGAGAYLVDNRGRTARVAGPAAEISTELHKQGPLRVVVRREGWYVTDTDERVARAKAWFYFTAGSPHLRVTHTLVFTEDTNELWVRDYGLEFNTPAAPDEAVFALYDPAPEEKLPMMGGRGMQALTPEQVKGLSDLYFSALYTRPQNVFVATPDDDEVYMLQDVYPHMRERDLRAVIARAPPAGTTDATQLPGQGVFWNHAWLDYPECAGDWAEAVYGDHALAVVVPQLAQRFPKEIAIGPHGPRVALWSGRSGRELDFRAVTLVNEYWQTWAQGAWKAFRSSLEGVPRDEIGERAADMLAAYPSNAQCAARTHEVWLLPRREALSEPARIRRARAASHPPLVLADPAWLGATAAMGWPFHPVDDDNFGREEQVLRDLWHQLTSGANYNAGLRRSGFIAWGLNMNLHGAGSFFRISRLSDYALRRNAWNLLVRGGVRDYYDYGSRFNQFAGDWEMAHWTAGEKFKGGFADGNNDLPFYWGSSSDLRGSLNDVTGHTIENWLWEYYLTGNEYPLELVKMLAQAYRERGAADMTTGLISHINVLNSLCAHLHDDVLRDLARGQIERLIDLDNPTGLDDQTLRLGVYYKTHRSLLGLYNYYQATGDEQARTAFLKGVEDKYRYHLVFDRTNHPGGRGAFGRSYSAFLFSMAYLWTGRYPYLQIVDQLNRQFREGEEGVGLITQMAPFMGVPAALAVLAAAKEPIAPFPVLSVSRDGKLRLPHDFVMIEAAALPPLQLAKPADAPVHLAVYLRMSNEVSEDTPARAQLASSGPGGDMRETHGIEVTAYQSFDSRASRRDLRRWHMQLKLPADLPAGDYLLSFPDAGTVIVLESDAPQLSLAQW